MTRRLRFGTFTPPIQRPDQNPTLALHRVLEMVEYLDKIGFDEAWFGEHHNGGWELIPCPELFIAAAATLIRWVAVGLVSPSGFTPAGPMLACYLITVAVYPLVSWLLSKAQTKLMGPV